MEKRGFENPVLLIKWNSFHAEAKNYYPSKIIKNKEGRKTLIISATNKMAGVAFAYVKKDLLYSINTVHLFHEISDIILTKSE